MLRTSIFHAIKRAKQYYFTTILTLSITLAMVLSAFSLVDLVFFSPLPYKNSDNLYLLEGTIHSKSFSGPATNSQVMSHIQSKNSIFSEFATYHRWSEYKILDNPSRPSVDVLLASHNLFDVLGVKPKLGRLFNKTEALGSKQLSVVLGYRAWKTYYNSDPNIVGKRIQLNQRRFTVVGVAPDNLVLPKYENINDGIWLPLDVDETFDPTTAAGFMGAYKGVVRLAPVPSLQAVSYTHLTLPTIYSV